MDQVMIQGIAVLLLLCINSNSLAANLLPSCSMISKTIGSVKFPDLLNSNQYYVCENGMLLLRSCDIGQIFDSYKLECVFTIENGKEKHDLLDLTSNYLHTFNVKDVLGKLIMTEIGDEPICKRSEFYKTAFPNDCKKYYECNHGLLKIYKCFLPFNFDPVSNQCKWYWLVDCKSVTTKTTLSTSAPPTISSTSTSSAPPTTSSTSTSSAPLTTSKSATEITSVISALISLIPTYLQPSTPVVIPASAPTIPSVDSILIPQNLLMTPANRNVFP